jgi:ferredoxin
MGVVVNFDPCDSKAHCVLATPEVFERGDDDYLYVIDEGPDERL